MPEIAAPPKIAKIKAYGAEVVVKGAAYADAQALCDAYVAESGALAIHPYATAATIAGQGTVGLEWEEDLARLGLPPIDTALVAVGGGGLIAGVAAWFDGRVKVVGVEPEGSRALDAALAAGRPVDVPVKSVAADSLGARSVGALNLAIARRAVDHVALVADAAIRAAQRRCGARCRSPSSPAARPPSPPGERRLSAGRRRTGRRARSAAPMSTSTPWRRWSPAEASASEGSRTAPTRQSGRQSAAPGKCCGGGGLALWSRRLANADPAFAPGGA